MKFIICFCILVAAAQAWPQPNTYYGSRDTSNKMLELKRRALSRQDEEYNLLAKMKRELENSYVNNVKRRFSFRTGKSSSRGGGWIRKSFTKFRNALKGFKGAKKPGAGDIGDTLNAANSGGKSALGSALETGLNVVGAMPAALQVYEFAKGQAAQEQQPGYNYQETVTEEAS